MSTTPRCCPACWIPRPNGSRWPKYPQTKLTSQTPTFGTIEGHGADPYIPFKSNTTGQGSPMWKRLYAYFTLNEDLWKRHYHKRSNVETAFSMIKGKFGDSVRAKSETGQVNEILLKCLCHNICVLARARCARRFLPRLLCSIDYGIS